MYAVDIFAMTFMSITNEGIRKLAISKPANKGSDTAILLFILALKLQ